MITSWPCLSRAAQTAGDYKTYIFGCTVGDVTHRKTKFSFLVIEQNRFRIGIVSVLDWEDSVLLREEVVGVWFFHKVVKIVTVWWEEWSEKVPYSENTLSLDLPLFVFIYIPFIPHSIVRSDRIFWEPWTSCPVKRTCYPTNANQVNGPIEMCCSK